MQTLRQALSAGDLGKGFQATDAGGNAKTPRAALLHPHHLGLAAHPMLPSSGESRGQHEHHLQQAAILDAARGV